MQHLIAEYAKAVDKADVMLVREIWSNSPDVSFIHPLGHEHGIDQVAEIRRRMGDTLSERKFSIRDVSIHFKHAGSKAGRMHWRPFLYQTENCLTVLQFDGNGEFVQS